MEMPPVILPKERKDQNMAEHFVLPGVEELEASYKNAKTAPLGKRGFLSELFVKKFGDNEYRVDLLSGETTNNEVFFKLLNQKQKKLLAELRFRVQRDKEGNTFYNLHHRLVESQDIGISGSLFLKRAEEYLTFLKGHSDTPDEIRLGSNQSNVSDWLIKNGYDFLNSKDQLVYEHLKEEPKEYRSVPVFIDGEKKDPVLFKKEIFSDKNVLQFLDTSGGDEVFRVSAKDFPLFQNYIPNVFFRKKI